MAVEPLAAFEPIEPFVAVEPVTTFEPVGPVVLVIGWIRARPRTLPIRRPSAAPR
ncbi:MAG: hypothetical protein QM820_27145 [Minicystis sp.]